MLATSTDASAVMDHFAEFEDITSTIVRGDTKMSVRLDDEFQVDLRVVPEDSFGAALQYFTGSKEHNVQIRGKAKQLGLKINEWGVYKVDGETEEWVAGKAEADVYKTLDLPCFEPELRESRQEFDWAEKNAIPKLITVDDMRGDLPVSYTHLTLPTKA